MPSNMMRKHDSKVLLFVPNSAKNMRAHKHKSRYIEGESRRLSCDSVQRYKTRLKEK